MPSYSLVKGTNYSTGDTVTATNLNAHVDNAKVAFVSGGILVGRVSSGAGDWEDVPISSFGGSLIQASNSDTAGNVLNFNDGTKLHSTTKGLTVADSDASSQIFLGQDSTHGLSFLWNYNATPANATAGIETFGKTNELTIGAKALNFDSSALAFAVRVLESGRVLIGGAGVVDDGASNLQVPVIFPTTGIKGIGDNSSAGAGYVGQAVSSYVASGSAVPLTSGAAANITSISLPAGDWDVSGFVAYLPANTTNWTLLTSDNSTTSATVSSNSPSIASLFISGGSVGDGSNFTTLTTPARRISVNTTTTVYLVGRASFSVSTLSAWGGIIARLRR